VGPYARWEDLPPLPLACSATPAHGGQDMWSIRWMELTQPADDPAQERWHLRQVCRPSPARGWSAAGQATCTFPPPVSPPVFSYVAKSSTDGSLGQTNAERMGDCYEAVLYPHDWAVRLPRPCIELLLLIYLTHMHVHRAWYLPTDGASGSPLMLLQARPPRHSRRSHAATCPTSSLCGASPLLSTELCGHLSSSLSSLMVRARAGMPARRWRER
jgi:hypothetical protein